MGCCSSRLASAIKHPYPSAERRNRDRKANNGHFDGTGGVLGGIQLDKVNQGLEVHLKESVGRNAGSSSPESEGVSPLDLGPGILPMGRTISGGESLEIGRAMPQDLASPAALVSKYCPISGHGEYQVRGYPIGEGTLEICPACRAVGESDVQAVGDGVARALVTD